MQDKTDTYEAQLRQAAGAALADADALELTGEDRAIVLKALLEARLGNLASPGPPRKMEDHQSSGPPAYEPGQQIREADVIDRISTVLNVDRELLELIYDVRDGEPHLVISARKIPENKASATRQLGQLVAAARQAAGLEDWTSTGVIRAVVQDYGRLDSSNFATNIQQMDGVGVVRGKGQQREIKITKPGLENTAELIKNLAGAGS